MDWKLYATDISKSVCVCVWLQLALKEVSSHLKAVLYLPKILMLYLFKGDGWVSA